MRTEGTDRGPEAFQPKFLNIMDPMLATNNLGRSVSKVNAARIRAAWAHAADTLDGIMRQVLALLGKLGMRPAVLATGLAWLDRSMSVPPA